MKTNTKATKGKATKATKATKAVEITDEVVLDAKSDITAVEAVETATSERDHVCSISGVKAEFDADGNCTNFSRLQNGKLRSICKAEQTKASIAWTTKRADYRKDYQRAVHYQSMGIPALTPDAKTWVAGQPIMTVEYTDKNGVTHPSRNADEVFAEMKQAQAEARQALLAERAEQVSIAKAQRAEARAEAKAIRDAEKAEAKAVRDAERAERKAEKAQERALKAEQAKADREAKAVARAEARAERITLKAQEAQKAREAKAIERAEATRLKAEAKALEIAQKAEAKQSAGIEKALSAIAGA